MATNSFLHGTNFFASSSYIRFFNEIGRKLPDGNIELRRVNSMIWQQLQGSPKAQISILEALEKTKQTGRHRLISYIVINASKAVLLYLEGALTENHLKNAETKKDHIEIYMSFAGRGYRVLIKDDRKMNVDLAIKDRYGHVV